jgi:hypothetical protein
VANHQQNAHKVIYAIIHIFSSCFGRPNHGITISRRSASNFLEPRLLVTSAFGYPAPVTEYIISRCSHYYTRRTSPLFYGESHTQSFSVKRSLCLLVSRLQLLYQDRPRPLSKTLTPSSLLAKAPLDQSSSRRRRLLETITLSKF